MKRRDFTKKSFAAAAGLLHFPGLVSGAETGENKRRKIPKTDTHVHLFDLQRLAYPWLDNAPEINRDFGIGDFQKASRRSNIGKILFMESGAAPAYSVKEVKWVSELARKEPRIKGIIARQDLSKGLAIAEALRQLTTLELLKGIRGGFPKGADQSRGFLEGLRLLADRRLTFDFLLGPPLLETAAKVAEKCPANVFVLDHIGNPDIKGGDATLWEAGIRQLADLPNVNCKISGIITRVGTDWQLSDIEPYVSFVMEQFGVDRLVYGGDWPVVLRADSYQSWSRAFEKLTSSLSTEDRHKVYHLNADRIYQL